MMMMMNHQTSSTVEPKKEVAKWYPPNTEQASMGISAIIQCRKTIKNYHGIER